MKYNLSFLGLSSITLSILFIESAGLFEDFQSSGENVNKLTLSDTTQTTTLNSIQRQLDSLTQSLNSYVQGYQELRTKYDGVKKDLNNITASLQQKITDYDNVVNRYLVLEQEYNLTKSVISDLGNRVLMLEQMTNSSLRGESHLITMSVDKLSKRINILEQIQGTVRQLSVLTFANLFVLSGFIYLSVYWNYMYVLMCHSIFLNICVCICLYLFACVFVFVCMCLHVLLC